MALDTLPMTDIFEKCSNVLDKILVPLHYTNLTELALEEFGLSKNKVNWQRQIEDVREKMLIAGQYGSFYIPAPYCLAAKNLWFRTNQLALFHTDYVIIPGHAKHGVDGAFEALMRDPYMQIKTVATRPRVMRGRASGLVLQEHVSGWFKKSWPDFWLLPDNHEQWTMPCDHDFKLNIGDKVFKVDVAGPKRNGEYGSSPGKKGTSLHLLCRIIGQDVMWDSILTGNEYTEGTLPELGRSPKRMVVWLNCHAQGIDYSMLEDYASNGNYQQSA